MYVTLNTDNLLNITVSLIHSSFCSRIVWTCTTYMESGDQYVDMIYMKIIISDTKYIIHFEKTSDTKVWNADILSKHTFNGSLKSKLSLGCHPNLLVMEYSHNFLSSIHYFLHYFAIKYFISQPTQYFILLHIILFMPEEVKLYKEKVEITEEVGPELCLKGRMELQPIVKKSWLLGKGA